ncbi:MAG: protein MraZ [Chitinophagaceae bacterium]|nr:protein MraZ [Chitinophagaceae bacterium]
MSKSGLKWLKKSLFIHKVVESGRKWLVFAFSYLFLFKVKTEIMAYLSGEYECKLDAKGRMVLPARIKSTLPDVEVPKVFVKRGFEACLVLYPELEWKKVYSRVAGLSEFNEEQRNFQRNFFSGSAELELDTASRFLIPKLMLKYADIDKDAIVVGVGNRVEIWNPDKYNQYLIKDQSEFSKQAEKFLSGQ